jgi:NitT/TauT family transport system substrate-binding protein
MEGGFVSSFPRGYSLLVFLFSLLLLAPGSLPAEEHDQTERTKLRVVALPFLGYAPFFIAEEEGYFAEQGLEIEFISLHSTSTVVAALIQGEIDVTAGTLWPSHLNAIARGARIRCVANRNYVADPACTYSGILARRALLEGGTLDDPAAWRGLRVSVNKSSCSAYLVEKCLELVGLTIDDVETVDLASPVVELEAFGRGTVDLAVAAEPWVTRTIQDGNGAMWMTAGSVVPGFQWGFILYGPTLLDENPEAGRRFMVAYLKAVEQYRQGKTKRNLEIVARHTRLDSQLLEQTRWPTLRRDGRVDFAGVRDFQHWAAGRGLVDSLITEEQFFDPRFVEYAARVLHVDQGGSE